MELVRRHQVLCFFVLAYVLAWGAIPWGSFFAPGALIAALVVAGLADGWAGLRDIGARLIRWRVSWVWYALAVAGDHAGARQAFQSKTTSPIATTNHTPM